MHADRQTKRERTDVRKPIGVYPFLCEHALRRNNIRRNGFFENVADLIYF